MGVRNLIEDSATLWDVKQVGDALGDMMSELNNIGFTCDYTAGNVHKLF